MFGSEVLEVGIGMALLFLFVSLIATAAQEAIEGLLKTRAGDLERGIRELLNDRSGTGLAKELYEHPLVYSLYSGNYDSQNLRVPGLLRSRVKPKGENSTSNGEEVGTNNLFMSLDARKTLPSYIPASHFALALLDIVARGPASQPGQAGAGAALAGDDPGAMDSETLRQAAESFPDQRIGRVILSALDAGQNDLDKVRLTLERWYDGTMDRVSGWYKRRTQTFLFFFGLGVAIVLNVDAVTVASRLLHDKTLREAVVAQADAYVAAAPSSTAAQPRQGTEGTSAPPPVNSGGGTPQGSAADSRAAAPGSLQRVAQLKAELGDVGYPIGWRPPPQAPTCSFRDPAPCGRLILSIPGWLITALAVMLGAPFWFDPLNKFMVIRSTVKPREKSPEEGSEDRPKSRGSDPSDAEPSGGDAHMHGGTRGGARPTFSASAAAAAAASVATAVALADDIFIPHEWIEGHADAGDL